MSEAEEAAKRIISGGGNHHEFLAVARAFLELKAENSRLTAARWNNAERAQLAEASLAASEERGRKLEEALREIIERKDYQGESFNFQYDEEVAARALAQDEPEAGISRA